MSSLLTAADGLTPAELRRYARHVVIPEVGLAGQERLKAARVLVVGAGGLGSPLALYLAAAGVGTLGLVDDDTVDESNLQRQVLYGQPDIGRAKLDAAFERLRQVNPHIRLVAHGERLAAANALELVRGYDVVADGTDNFPTRYLVNDACVLAGKPDVWGAILRFEGQVSVFWAAEGPCYRCLFPEPPPPGLVPSCAEGGVFGVLPGVIGSIQAVEVIKLILGAGEPLVGRLLLFDAWRLRFREVKLRKDAACPVCSERPAITRLIDIDTACASRAPDTSSDLAPSELAARLGSGRPLTLLDVRDPWEWEMGRIEGASLLPLGELPERLGELDPAGEIVLYCHTGVRSHDAMGYLLSRGFRSVRHLAGGIEAWRREIDPSLPRY